jgi:hypothetical protein
LPAGNGASRAIMADVRLADTQHFKVPHLRNLYQKTGFANTAGAASIAGFGFSHDGRDAGLFDHFVAPRFGVLTNDSPTANLVKSNLVALLLCFDTGTAPAVGYARTITPLNVNTASISNDWSLLERQATLRFQDAFILAGFVTNISLIANGTIDGQRRSLIYRPASTNYVTDKTGVGPFTHAELTAKVLGGDTLSVMGVPPVSGQRMGIDRNWNGVLDGEESPPLLTAVRTDTGLMISWPTNSVGALLEFTENLSSRNWRTETSLRSLSADRLTVTVPMTDQNRFYRLRGL